jgi:hypothetical protein
VPGPERLEQVIGLLHAHHQRDALAGLCQQVAPGQTGPSDTVLGIAWATPDIVRSSAPIIAPFVPRPRDRVLGAQAVGVRFGRVELLLAQPAGRAGIAAFVSRYGEGVAAIYLDRLHFRPPSSASRKPPRPEITALGRRGWLLPHEWPWGPFIVVLERR